MREMWEEIFRAHFKVLGNRFALETGEIHEKPEDNWS
jgi:hypothetical protein